MLKLVNVANEFENSGINDQINKLIRTGKIEKLTKFKKLDKIKKFKEFSF